MLLVTDNNISHQIDSWEVQVNWTGTHTNLNSYQPAKHFFHKKFYLEPYFLLNFFPYQSLKWGKSFKLFLGFKIKNLLPMTNKEKKLLQRLHNDDQDFHNYQWGLTINDNLKKGCTFFYKKINKLNKKAFTTSLKDNNFNPDFNWKKAFLIPWKCLKKDKNNYLKVWWKTISNNKKNWSLPNVDKIIINFFYPKEKVINIDLTTLKNQNYHFSHLYLITTKLKKTPQVFPIGWTKISFFSQLKSLYFFPQPLQSLWYFYYWPFSIDPKNLTLIFNYFHYTLFLSEISKWQNDNIFSSINFVKTSLLNKPASSLSWQGQILKNSPILTKIPLRLAKTIYSSPKTEYISYLKYLYYHTFFTKSYWDYFLKKLVISAPDFLFSWFDQPQNFKVNIKFVTSLIWTTVYDLKLFFWQNLHFDNTAFWKKQKLVTNQSLPKKRASQILVLLLPLEKIEALVLLKKWNLTSYSQWKKKWQKNYVQKDF